MSGFCLPVTATTARRLHIRSSHFCFVLSCPLHSVRAGRRWRVGTYGSTSCLARVSRGSRFGAMLPKPPRPVVTTGVLRKGVSRSEGLTRGDRAALAMLPAPPRPVDVMLDMLGDG
jgi:hypothetical protein